MRGRVTAAASAYHAVRRPNVSFLGVLKVAPADRAELATAARQLATMASPSPEWAEELDAKARMWRTWLADRRFADDGDDLDEAGDDEDAKDERPRAPAGYVLPEADEAEVRRRLAAASQDVGSLLLVGLVRAGVRVGVSPLRRFFWARPLTEREVDDAARALDGFDEDGLLLDSAVKGSDGFFTTFFVSPYSRYIARWAARRGLTPNTVTTISMGIGIAAAVAFATGTRAGLIAGALLAYFAFVTDCVDGQLARYTRTFSKLGAWLDSIFDRSKEYVIFAGLAIGASRAGDDVWVLAVAALALQTARHTLEFSYQQRRQQVLGSLTHQPLSEPGEEPGWRTPARAGEAPPRTVSRTPLQKALGLWRRIERLPGVRWTKKMIHFPIGERFAAISITAAVSTPRTTFTVLLIWGGFAALYTVAGRVLRSLAA
jgi:phosphatidylglycerophosphate synthase